MSHRHIFSVDVECWHELISRQTGVSDGFNGIGFDRQMEVVLNLLAETKTSGTFFVLASVARHRPRLAGELVSLGHEVATHGTAHRPLTEHTPGSLWEDISYSKKLLEDQCGQEVVSHRAPIFSVVRSNLWALDVLAEVGLRIDSSIFPTKLTRFGISTFPRKPRLVRGPAGGEIFEVPLSTVGLLGTRFPVSGGSYLRLLPYGFLRRALDRLEIEELPFVLYSHPYEFDSLRLRPPSSLRFMKRTYIGSRWNAFRKSMVPKMRQLLLEHKFGRMDDFVWNLNYEKSHIHKTLLDGK